MNKKPALLLLPLLWGGVALASDHDDADIAFAQAQTAVQAAEAADAAADAAGDMNAAESNLAAARGALDRRDWDASVMNSEKARADANLAVARARQQRATAATAEIEASVETLRRELNRPGS